MALVTDNRVYGQAFPIHVLCFGWGFLFYGSFLAFFYGSYFRGCEMEKCIVLDYCDGHSVAYARP